MGRYKSNLKQVTTISEEVKINYKEI